MREYPKTVQEAVKRLLSELPDRDPSDLNSSIDKICSIDKIVPDVFTNQILPIWFNSR